MELGVAAAAAPDGEQTPHRTTAIAVQQDLAVLKLLASAVHQAGQAAPQGCSVRIACVPRHLCSQIHLSIVQALSAVQGDLGSCAGGHGILCSLCCSRNTFPNRSPEAIGMGQGGNGLARHAVEGRMEDRVIRPLQRVSLWLAAQAIGEGVRIETVAEGAVAQSQYPQVAIQRLRAIPLREVAPDGLVEVEGVLHVQGAGAPVYHQRCIRPYQHCDGAGAARGTGGAGGIHGGVRGHHDGQPPVPGAPLHPVHRVEHRRRAPEAGAHAVYALHAVVARCSEHRHEVALDGLAAVRTRLRTHLQPANLPGVDAVRLQQPMQSCERH
mmetsp:Transcript_7051/g.20649  ORF Transcript_7051/g.20649 Transcript_7051/m.20649 type:complete len:325 (+) Transcript_7051:1331-2305(+)